MYLIVIGWLYVTLLMALAEAFGSQGSVLGAIITFVFYGLLPMALVVYLMNAPARRRRIKEREAAEQEDARIADHISSAASRGNPDAGGKSSTDAVAPVRKET